MLYSYTNSVRGRYIAGSNVEEVSAPSSNSISALVAVRGCWIETLGELWSCTVESVGVVLMLRGEEKNHCSDAGNTISTQ